MKRFFFCVLILVCGVSFADDGASFDLAKVKASDVVSLIYRDVLNASYVLDSDVLSNDKVISFKATLGKQAKRDALQLLDGMGYRVKSRNGVDYISLKKEDDEDKDVFVYSPKYRDTSFLIELLRSIFKGSFTVTRSVSRSDGSKPDAQSQTAPAGSAAALIDKSADVLVFNGSPAEIRQLEKLLKQVDTRLGEVMVRAIVYEVGSTDKDGSAFSLALNLLGGKLTASGGALNALDNVVRFKNATIDAVFSALSTDSRFKVVSSPSLRVRSGSTGRFSVGQEVPVLGAVTYPSATAAPVQSVDYRSSGVIFDLQPVVRDEVVDLNLSQQVSSFVTTDTGVNNSPTLTKREVKTSLSLQDGEMVLIGGLTQDTNSNARNGLSFLPEFLKTKTHDKTGSEILVVLQVTKI